MDDCRLLSDLLNDALRIERVNGGRYAVAELISIYRLHERMVIVRSPTASLG